MTTYVKIKMKTINLYATLKEFEKTKEIIKENEIPSIGIYLYQIRGNDYEFASFGEKSDTFANLSLSSIDKVLEKNKGNNEKFCIKLKKVGDYWEID